jgi:hypothetical protein
MHNSAQPPETYRRPGPKTGRSQPCPCGSGKKYKHCCLDKSAAGVGDVPAFRVADAANPKSGANASGMG